MKSILPLFVIILTLFYRNLPAQQELNEMVISGTYLELWNPEVQNKNNHNIDQYSKAYAITGFENISTGTRITNEQTSHNISCRGNIFLFGDLKSRDKNEEYEDTFGTLLKTRRSQKFYRENLSEK